MSKISIRFFDDREVRAIWDEENKVINKETSDKIMNYFID